MQIYCGQVFHQLELIISSSGELISTIEESEWELRPTEGKFSIGELASHLALVCAADLYIANGATENDMRSFYESRMPTSKDQALAELGRSFDGLKSFYLPLNERQLLETHAAYWGVSYSRFEWLLETLVHLTHHRAQLHSMIVHCLKKEPNIALFE